MTNYIYLNNFYLSEIQSVLQDFFNTNFDENSVFYAEIFMKNSRTYYIKFSKELSFQKIMDLLYIFKQNEVKNDRLTSIEGNFKLNDLLLSFYFIDEDLYYINSNNETFKIENQQEISQSNNTKFNTTEIPSKGLHYMDKISYLIPKKKWWKFW